MHSCFLSPLEHSVAISFLSTAWGGRREGTSRESGAGVQAEKLPRAFLEPGSAAERCRNQWRLRTVFSGVLCLGYLQSGLFG